MRVKRLFTVISQNTMMMKNVKKLINRFLEKFNYRIMRYQQVGRDRHYIDQGKRYVNFNGNTKYIAVRDPDLREKWVKEFLIDQSRSNIVRVLASEAYSKSQFKQDLFVLSELNFKDNGFFVEFGASDGISLSNSYLLEKKFGWNGIVAEPTKKWHKPLRENRNCFINTDCVWSKSNEKLDFTECGVLSTISDFIDVDHHTRVKQKHYLVNTITLCDLLDKFDAPRSIDYLSVDTEGSEFEILNSFDFNKYDIKIITVEHNYTPMREKIFELLTKHHYKRKYTAISKCDDWYVKSDE